MTSMNVGDIIHIIRGFFSFVTGIRLQDDDAIIDDVCSGPFLCSSLSLTRVKGPQEADSERGACGHYSPCKHELQISLHLTSPN
jgi:hypothetical protein